MYYLLLRRVRQYLDPGRRSWNPFTAQRSCGGPSRLGKGWGEITSASRSCILEPKFWYEIVETIRKLVLTGGLIFLGSGSRNQIGLSIVICSGALRCFSSFKPYIKDFVDVFSEACHWQIFFVMFSPSS